MHLLTSLDVYDYAFRIMDVKYLNDAGNLSLRVSLQRYQQSMIRHGTASAVMATILHT